MVGIVGGTVKEKAVRLVDALLDVNFEFPDGFNFVIQNEQGHLFCRNDYAHGLDGEYIDVASASTQIIEVGVAQLASGSRLVTREQYELEKDKEK